MTNQDPLADIGILREGTNVHATDLTFEGHRIWLQDDTDAATHAQQVEKLLTERLLGAPDESWKPRVAKMGKNLVAASKAALDAVDQARAQLAEAVKAAVTLSEIDKR